MPTTVGVVLQKDELDMKRLFVIIVILVAIVFGFALGMGWEQNKYAFGANEITIRR